MNLELPPENVPTPRFLSDLVALSYEPDVYLEPQTQTRWRLFDDELNRDYDGESDWAKMAEYVGKTYSNVFCESYRRELDRKQV